MVESRPYGSFRQGAVNQNPPIYVYMSVSVIYSDKTCLPTRYLSEKLWWKNKISFACNPTSLSFDWTRGGRGNKCMQPAADGTCQVLGSSSVPFSCQEGGTHARRCTVDHHTESKSSHAACMYCIYGLDRRILIDKKRDHCREKNIN